MIKYYYKVYNEGPDELLQKITPRGIDYFSDFVDAENDIYLIHAIYALIVDKGMQTKSDIFDYVWRKVSHLYVEKWERSYDGMQDAIKSAIYPYSEAKSKRIFKGIFDEIWKMKFSLREDGKYAHKMSTILRRHLPVHKRFFYSYTFVILYTIAFIIGTHYIVNNYSICAPKRSMIGVGTFFIIFYGQAMCEIAKKSLLLPIVCGSVCLCLCIYHFFFLPESIIESYEFVESIRIIHYELCKSDVVWAILFLALYPASISINHIYKKF